MIRMTLSQFHQACRDQAPSRELIVFRCPRCKTLQCAQDWIDAGAGTTFEDVEPYLAYSCIGRFTGAPGARREPDGKPCDWTLGGLLRLHHFEVELPDGSVAPRFELATKEEADAHRAERRPRGSVA